MSNGFKRSVYSARVKNKGDNIYELLSASFQGVKRLFVLAYVIEVSAANSWSRYKKQ